MNSKKGIAIGLLLIATAVGMAQSSLVDSLSDYQGRFTKLNKAYAKEPSNVENLYNMAQFYFDNSHPMRNLPMAMKFVQQAESRQITLLEESRYGELTRLEHKNINLFTIRELKQAISDAAYNTIELRTDMSEVELGTYMDAFGLDMSMVRLLRQRRIRQVYDEDLHRGTLESYYHFIYNYPGTKEAEEMEARIAPLATTMFDGMATEAEVDEVAKHYTLSPSIMRSAERQKSKLAFAIASKKNTVAAYKDFLRRYPSSDENMTVRDRLDNMLESSFRSLHTARQYANFAKDNADISLADSALARMRKMVAKQRDVEAARIYLAEFKSDPYYNEVYNHYYSWHTLEGNSAPINKFTAEHPDFPFQSAIMRDLQRAEELDAMSLMGDFLEVEFSTYAAHIRRSMDKRIALVALQRSLQYLVSTRNYTKAVERLNMFDICFEGERRVAYKELKQVLSTPTSRRLVTELAATYNVKNPVVNEADGQLYFTRTSGPSSKICYAVNEQGKWRPAGEVEFDNLDNEGICIYGFYDHGTHMLIGRGGEIVIAEKEGNTWFMSEIPPHPLNSDYRDVDPFMIPDGSGMLIASDRPGGYNLQNSGDYFHGDTAMASDIYFVPLTNQGWGTPINLGPTINTMYSERSPILSRNLKTLYFISDGRGGLGYGDVYVAQRTSLDSWTSWSTPQNVGRELNTGYNEAFISFSPNERSIYLSSNSNLGRYSCYSFATWHNTSKQSHGYKLGVQGMDQYLSRVRLADLATQTVAQELVYQPEDHAITLNINKDKRYAVLADAGIYFVPAMLIDATTREGKMLVGYTYQDLVRMDKPVPLPAVSFNEATLQPIARLQLEQLATFMLRHQGAKVELVIDVAGRDDSRCYNLSLERGNVVKDLLVAAGIPEANIIVSAYGNVNCKKGSSDQFSIQMRERVR